MNEKEYQYSKESLLENPQTYQFTKFEGKEFLQRYVNSRKKIILKLGSSQYSDVDIEKVIEQEQNDSRNKNNTTIFELRRILLHIIKNNKVKYSIRVNHVNIHRVFVSFCFTILRSTDHSTTITKDY